MELDTAARAFRALEEMRFHYNGVEAGYPLLLVRLEASTDRETDERDFRLFVRVNQAAPESWDQDNLRAIIDVAKELDLMVELENDGVALTQDVD